LIDFALNYLSNTTTAIGAVLFYITITIIARKNKKKWENGKSKTQVSHNVYCAT